MKRIFCLLLMLLLLTACAEEAKPSVRYENDAAYYEEESASLSMELHFAAPVAEGSEIKLLNGETTVISLKTDSALQTLTLRSSALEENVPYTLTVNGVVQQHGMQLMPPSQVIDIPDQPTIPMEPMSEQPSMPMEPMSEQPSESENAGGFTPGAGTQPGMGAPSEDIGVPPGRDGEISPPEMPPEFTGGERPNEDFGGRKPPEEDGLRKDGPTTFMITSNNQRFTDVRDAVMPEGKEPNA